MRKPDWSEVYDILAKGRRAFSRCQWEAGDELIRQIGKPSPQSPRAGSAKLIDDCMEFLEARGIDEYEPASLRNLWQTAAHFPPETRKALPWHVHHLSGTPEMLAIVIESAPRNQKITVTYASKVMRALALERQRELDAETARRQAAHDKAKAEREEAEREKAKAKTAADRKAAQDKADAAARKQEKNASPPKRRDIPTPKPKNEDMPLIIARAQFAADIGSVDKGLRKLRETFEPYIPIFPDADRDAGHERLMGIAEKARGFAELLRRTGRASHLSVVGETGAA